MPRSRDRSRRRHYGAALIKTILVLIVLLGLAAALTLVFLLLQPLPAPQPPLASEIYDANGQLVGTIGTQRRIEVTLNQVPLDFQRAIVAIEDHRFFQHRGVDLRGILRAIWINIRTLERRHGASTITQQLARNAYGLTQKKLFTRKVREAIIALKLERRYTKEEILEMYINTIYFGHGCYGVEAAARIYFDKPASQLTLPESALLAGIVRGPAIYSPYINMEKAKDRRNLVLDRMAEVGFITHERAERAKQVPIEVAGLPEGGYNIDHFRNAVVHYLVNELFKDRPLEERYELLRTGGLKIYTTMDLNMQEAAERAVEWWDKQPRYEGLQIALTAVDPSTGAVRAIVGSRDLSKSAWIRAFARRSPGSAFKPFLYLAALESRQYTAASVFVSEPAQFDIRGQDEPYVPTEWIEGYFGPLTLREAIARSSNVVTLKLNYQMASNPYSGPWSQQLIDAAHRLGITSPLEPVLSLPLGVSPVTPLEMAAAYAAFANGGYRVEPYYIARIVDRNGRVLLENRPRLVQAADPRAVYIVTDMLRDVIYSNIGTGRALRDWFDGRPIAGKTGTSQDGKDGWFVGFSPQISCAVWTGDDQNQISGLSGVGTAGEVWARFMAEALRNLPYKDFERPAGLVNVRVDKTTGQVATSQCPQEAVYEEVFIEGTQPTTTCEEHPELPWPPKGGNIWDWWEWLFPN